MGNRPMSLAERLRYNDRSLTELDLVSPWSSTYDDEKEWNDMMRSLRRNRTVMTVVIGNLFSDSINNGSSRWSGFWNALGQLRNLQQLELYETDISLSLLTQLLKDSSTTLKALAIHDGVSIASMESGMDDFCLALSETRNLQEVALENGFASLSIMTNDGQYHNSTQQQQQCPLDCLLITLGNLPHLKLLALVNSGTTNPDTTSPSSAELISPSTLKTFCQACPASLETLHLVGCGLRHEHCVLLEEYFSDHPSLRNVFLQHNQFWVHHDDDDNHHESIATLINWLVKSPNIHHLYVGKNGLLEENNIFALEHPQPLQIRWQLFLNRHVRTPLRDDGIATTTTDKQPPNPHPNLIHTLFRMRYCPNTIYYLLQQYPQLYSNRLRFKEIGIPIET